MRAIILLASLGLLACEISPVIADPTDVSGDRYLECRRAAQEYCEQVETGQDPQACVARATYDCVSAPPR